MKRILTISFLLLSLLGYSQSANCGGGNTENFPAGTWVIGMDNTTQPGLTFGGIPPGYINGGGGTVPFNLRAYGLVNELLQNDIPIYWAIDSGKAKNAIDFSSTGFERFPTLIPGSTPYDFRSGPMVIHMDDTTAAKPIIQAFANSVKVYQLDAATSIEYKYKLAFKPNILVLNNGGKKGGKPWQYDKNTRILLAAGINMANVDTTDAVSVSLDANSCYTFASEAHWKYGETGDVDATTIGDAPLHTSRINQFVLGGGNFLTQCAGIEAYEDHQFFQTTNGIEDDGTHDKGNEADAHADFNYDHPFYQIHGNVTNDPTGTFVDYTLDGGSFKAEVDTFIHKSPAPSNVVCSGIKLTGADTLGGNVFYLGGHDYTDRKGTGTQLDPDYVNGVRLYLNAILIPAYRPSCPSIDFCSVTSSCNLDITCPTIDTALANASCQYVLGDYRDSATVNASCGLDSIQQIPAVGTAVNAGVQEIFLVATDSSGNTDTCSFNLVITIPINPQVVVCGDAFTNETTQNFNDNLNNFTGCTNHPTTGEDKYYQITVPSGNYQIQVTMDNMVDDEEARADIFWLGGSCPSTTNCLAQTEFRQSDQEFTATNSNKIVYYATGPGTYYLVVDATIDYIDQYDISFDCVQSGIIFDTINSACDSKDLNNDGLVAYVDGDTSLVVNKCDTFSFRHDMYIANVNGVEWMDTVNFSLDSCYENVHNIIPNGVNNAMENPAGGDWSAVYTAGTNNIAWSFSDVAYANQGYGDGSQFSGSYSCNQGSTHDYMFSFDATIKENCPIASTLPISILVRDDGVSTAATSPGLATEISDDFKLVDTPPIFTSCANNQTLYADASCGDTLINYMDSVVVTDNCGTPTLTQNPAVGTTVTGSSIVWIIAEDASGNKDSCSFNVSVMDTTRPAITCIANQTRYVDAACSYSLEDFGVVATDNCQMQSNIQSPAAGTAFGRDTVTVTVTATDTAGNISVCTFDVFILDTISPVINCPANQNETPDASCQFVLPYYGTATATDNCSLDTVIQSPAQGTTITGTTVITLTAQDSSGNTSVCTFDVILTDLTSPIFTSCANNQILYADASCGDTLINYMDSVVVTDNCGTPTLTQNPAVGTTVTGSSIVWIIAEDASGNKDSCSFNVSVMDTTRPAITCIANQTRYVDAACSYSLEDFGVVATDNCQMQSNIQSPAAGTAFGRDTVTVTVTATDTAGNISVCTFDVFILDTISPVINCPANQNETPDASCQFVLPYYGTATATDNCSLDTVIQSPAQGTTITGTTVITLTAQDSSGNTSVCTFDVILTDVTPPIFTSCANNQILYADASCGDTLINYMDSVVVTDNCGTPTLTQNPVVGTTVTGSSIVWIIAEDASGNKDSCSFNVSVMDTTRPAITCIANQTRYVDATCSYSLEDFGVVATDNCQMQSNIQSPAAGTAFGRDTVTVTVTAADTAGNVSVCTFEVFILDTISPVITCPSNQNETPNASCQFVLPYYGGATATDNCSFDTVIQSPAQGTTITGTTTITLTAQDSSGNTSVCTFDVILTDVTPPVFTSCANDQTLYADASCGNTLINYMDSVVVTDNCGTPTLTQNPVVGTTVTGSSIVWVIAEDANGNKDSCSFNVSVMDTTRPSFTCLGNQARSVPINCFYTLEDFTTLVGVADNCSLQSVTQTPTVGTSLSLGSSTIVVTATDTAGNVNTCTFDVVIDDTVSIICPSDISTCDSLVVFPSPDVTDNCSSITLTQTDGTGLMSGSMFPVGITTLSYDATDSVGNSSSCSVNIEILAPADASWSGLPTSVCEDGELIDLSLLVTSGSTGTWSGNGVVGIAFNPSLAGNGVHNITFTAVNTSSCIADSTLTINVFENVLANAGVNDTVCADSVKLGATNELIGHWESISSNPVFEDSLDPSTIVHISEFANYIFVWSVDDTNCPDKDSVTVQFNEPLETPDAGPDQYLLGAVSAILDATSASDGVGLWNVVDGNGIIEDYDDPQSQVNELDVGENILTWTVTNGLCIPMSDSVIITVENIIIPTGFSPDGDGINDELVIEGIEDIIDNKIIIVNRWGAEIYETNDYQNDWLGVNKSGDKLPSDTYFMILISGDEIIAKTYLEIKY